MTPHIAPLSRRIVVGVDGSTGSLDALEWALEEGRRRGATVDVVHAYLPPAVDTYFAPTVDPVVFREAGASMLRAAIAHAAPVEGGPKVLAHLVMDSAGPALVERARGADLLVVSSHGHGAFAGMMLGSVSQYVTRHATCPVVVVPSRPPQGRSGGSDAVEHEELRA
jgi:nucleotide-binding universal stress UspA family protein